MRIEKIIDKRFMGYRSILGLYHWQREIKSIIMNKNASISDKLWCLNHGFSIGEYNLYGHENLKKNFRDYLSTKQYYRLHPINGMFSVWIDDKLTFRHIISGFKEYLPKYYFDIEDGEVLKLPDCPNNIKNNSFQGILELLKKEKKLVLKKY